MKLLRFRIGMRLILSFTVVLALIGDLLRALQSMNESLSGMVKEIRDGVHVIDDALTEIAADNDQLSARTR